MQSQHHFRVSIITMTYQALHNLPSLHLSNLITYTSSLYAPLATQYAPTGRFCTGCSSHPKCLTPGISTANFLSSSNSSSNCHPLHGSSPGTLCPQCCCTPHSHFLTLFFHGFYPVSTYYIAYIFLAIGPQYSLEQVP